MTRSRVLVVLALTLPLGGLVFHAPAVAGDPKATIPVEPTTIQVRVNGQIRVVGYEGEPETAYVPVTLYELDAQGNGLSSVSDTVVCREAHEHGKLCLAFVTQAIRDRLEAERVAQRAAAKREATRTERLIDLGAADVLIEERTP